MIKEELSMINQFGRNERVANISGRSALFLEVRLYCNESMSEVATVRYEDKPDQSHGTFLS